jgi:hypothetical protein
VEADHVFPRKLGMVWGVVLGVLIGVGNTFLDLDFASVSTPALLGLLLAAIALVLVLHEGVHGGVGVMLGHRPRFGVEPPLVYTTFDERLPRNVFLAVALAPLVVLDLVFVGLYLAGVAPLFANLCFAVNTIGAVGDVWIVLKLLGHASGVEVQDTKTGVEVWAREA